MNYVGHRQKNLKTFGAGLAPSQNFLRILSFYFAHDVTPCTK
jgi:hypothetical protein